jgi:hypothetical protein
VVTRPKPSLRNSNSETLSQITLEEVTRLNHSKKGEGLSHSLIAASIRAGTQSQRERKAAAVNYTTEEERTVLFQSQDSSSKEPHISRERLQHPTANAVPQTPPTAASKRAAACTPTQADERRGRTIGKFHTADWKEGGSKTPHLINPATDLKEATATMDITSKGRPQLQWTSPAKGGQSALQTLQQT